MPAPDNLGLAGISRKSWTVTGWQGGYKYFLDEKNRKRGFMVSAGDGAYILEMYRWFKVSEGTGYEFYQVSQVTVHLKDRNDRVVHEAQSKPLLIDRGALSVGIGWNDAYRQLEAWLDKHYPDWKNPAAYWD